MGSAQAAGGSVREVWARRVLGDRSGAAIAELCSASLVTRRASERGVTFDLVAPSLAPELGSALGSFAVVDALAAAFSQAPLAA